MDGNTAALYTRIILVRNVDVNSLIGSAVQLEVDVAYKIGRSIAVLHDGKVIGHLEKRAARVVWRHLRSDPVSMLAADIYSNLGNWKNKQWFSVLSHSYEIGVKVRFLKASGEDRRLLLAHITRKKLNSFAGVERSNCPPNLSSLVNPFEDENGVASLYFT